MPTRQAIIVEAFGGPDVLHLITEETPALEPGLIRVAIEAIGVNRADILLRTGAYHGARLRRGRDSKRLAWWWSHVPPGYRLAVGLSFLATGRVSM
jgi:hypothetical protein